MPRIGIPTSFQTRPTGWPNPYDQVARMIAEVLRGGGGGLGPPRTMQPGPFSGGLPLGGAGSSKTYGPTGQPFRTPPPQPLTPYGPGYGYNAPGEPGSQFMGGGVGLSDTLRDRFGPVGGAPGGDYGWGDF